MENVSTALCGAGLVESVPGIGLISERNHKLPFCCFSFPQQDQFDNLEKHTQWGIDILEKYIKFVKERTEIELSYAKQLR